MRIGLMCLAFLMASASAPAAEVDYKKDVKPILQARCYSCHGALRQKASLRLDAGSLIAKGGRKGTVLSPGKPDASPLIEAVLGKDRPRMPPEGEGEPLTAKEIATLRDWIAQGAKFPDEPVPTDPRTHWAFRPPVRPALPAQGTGNPIDAFLTVERARLGVQANPPADRTTLLRRVYLDLIGLPPTPDELQAFLADQSPEAYEKVVDRLLNSPQYGERWGRHWLDIWRYSDPFGFQDEYRYSQRHIWRWRDWVIESLNADHGYDRMILEMLAADEIAPGDPAALRATGYLARNWYKFNRNVWVQDTVEYTATGFLGLTMRCSRCHDHKYDPIPQPEYYRLRAFFEPHDVRIDTVAGQPDTNKDGVARVFDAKPDAVTYVFQRGDERNPDKTRAMTPGVPAILGGDVAIKPIRFTAKDRARGLPAAIDAARAKAAADLKATEAKVKATETALAAVKRLPLGAVLSGSSRVEAPFLKAKTLAELKHQQSLAVVAAVEARILAETENYSENFNESKWKRLAMEAGKAERKISQLQAEEALLLAESALAQARLVPPKDEAGKKALLATEQKVTSARQARDAATSAVSKEDPTYAPLVALNPATSTGRRLALAKWITDRGNPLTARVAVNHIWMRHFGKPLVGSVANFGLSGDKPTHPELLDWLAVEFMESGWKMKKLHRLMVTSRAYQMSSRDSSARSVDPENRAYWRTNPRRMEAEIVRDSLIALTGQLDRATGGPPIDEKQGLTNLRRSIYFRYNVEYRMAFLDQFDPPSPTECYQRHESVIPQQGLALMNSSLALNLSRQLAGELAGKSTDPARFTTLAFERILGRSPTNEEKDRAVRFLREQPEVYRNPAKLTPFPGATGTVTPPATDPVQHAREDLILVLFNHNDFVTVR